MFSGAELFSVCGLPLGLGTGRGAAVSPGTEPCGRAAVCRSRGRLWRRAGVTAGTRAVAACWADFGNTRGLVLGASPRS